MSNAISQMQMLYAPEEDRILFRVNSTDQKEFRLWMTRRFVLLLNKVLKVHMDSDPDVSVQDTPAAKEAVKEFKQEKAVEGADFNKQFNDKPNEIPLGTEIPLAFKLSYNIKGENMQLSLDPKKGPGINIVINRQITATLTQLIKNASQQGDWRMGQSDTSLMPESGGRVVN